MLQIRRRLNYSTFPETRASEYFWWFTDKILNDSNCVLFTDTNSRFVAAQCTIYDDTVWDYREAAVEEKVYLHPKANINVQQLSFCLISDSTSSWCWRSHYIRVIWSSLSTRLLNHYTWCIVRNYKQKIVVKEMVGKIFDFWGDSKTVNVGDEVTSSRQTVPEAATRLADWERTGIAVLQTTFLPAPASVAAGEDVATMSAMLEH